MNQTSTTLNVCNYAIFFLLFSVIFSHTHAQSVQWASKVLEVSSEVNSKKSCAGQVIGAPSVFPQGGKSAAAWQPAIKSNTQYVKIGFKKPMIPKQIIVAENFRPGAVSKIVLIDKFGKEHVVKKLKPRPVDEPHRIFHIQLDKVGFETTSMKLFLDVTSFDKMPQIDAIGMSEVLEDFQPKINLVPLHITESEAQNLGQMVNTIYKEVAPVISPDNKILYFTRDSPENIGGENQDVWVSEIDSTGNFKKSHNIGQPINNNRNNYASAITPDGQTMLLGNIYNEDGSSAGAGLSVSKKAGTKWGFPQKINIRNYDNYGDYTSAYLANDGKTLLVSITRTDTYGGEDIYVCFQDKNGNWTQPLNLGNKINTGCDEYTPFLASDLSTLYFTSEGFPGFGKGDIYMSKRLDNTWKNWSEPVNLGSTFNTPLSDFYFTIPASGEYAYFVSSTNSMGATDIFRVKLAYELQPSPVVLIKGHVLNAKTKAPVEGEVHYETLPQGEDKGHANAEALTGKYKIVLPPGSMYGFRATHPDYISVNENIDLQKIDKYVEIEKDLYLVPIEVGQIVEINNLFFESKKTELTPASFPEMDRLAETLRKNTNIHIEIGGHTDDVGSDQDNLKLSQDRANKVLQYLFNKGVEFYRMQAKGYGESKPIVPNDSEINRQQNRRVVFLIVKK